MDVTVTMTPHEFIEFTEWRKDTSVNSRLSREYASKLRALASRVLLTFEDRGQPESPDFRIISPSSVEDLLGMAQAYTRQLSQ